SAQRHTECGLRRAVVRCKSLLRSVRIGHQRVVPNHRLAASKGGPIQPIRVSDSGLSGPFGHWCYDSLKWSRIVDTEDVLVFPKTRAVCGLILSHLRGGMAGVPPIADQELGPARRWPLIQVPVNSPIRMGYPVLAAEAELLQSIAQSIHCAVGGICIGSSII